MKDGRGVRGVELPLGSMPLSLFGETLAFDAQEVFPAAENRRTEFHIVTRGR